MKSIQNHSLSQVKILIAFKIFSEFKDFFQKLLAICISYMKITPFLSFAHF
jgi:hypothetical protein